MDCLVDADCADGLFCNGDETCNTDTGECVPGEDYYCPQEHFLECFYFDGNCSEGVGCTWIADDTQCAAEEFCNIDGECEAIPPCTTDADCDDGFSCNDGTCEPASGQQFTVCSTPGLAIPDIDCTGITDTMTMADGCTIADVDVDLQINHTWVGDLVVSLSHGGETALLVGKPGLTGADCPACCGCSGNDIDVLVNDEGLDTPIEGQCADLPAISGNAPGGDPSGPVLSVFDGQSSAGDWTLAVSDGASGDTGTLVEWCVTVTCDVEECTFTFGYWKTHSEYGPAPYDDTWAQLANGADTVFFLSGLSYYEVLLTPPSGGNAYYILAHQYIAAMMNFLKGADPSAVQTAFDEATALFNAYTPDEIAAAKGKNGKELRQQFTSLAAILDDYNNGYIGPGHCVEEFFEACCLPDGSCTDLTPEECSLQGGISHGPGTDCANVECPTPPEIVACCLINGDCAELTPDECTAQDGLPHGPGSNCASVECLFPDFGSCCLPSGECFEGRLDICVIQGGVTYPNLLCDEVDCPGPPIIEACCMPNGECADMEPDTCTGQGGAPQGLDSYCVPFGCPVPADQACCLPDGTCIEMSIEECVNQGGEGHPFDCSTVECIVPPELEACCMPDGQCFEGPLEECVIQGGFPNGPGSTCSAVDCPQVPETSACCFPNGDCFEGPIGLCFDQGGVPYGPGSTCELANCMPDNSGGACCLPDGQCADMSGAECFNQGGELQPNRGCFEVECGPGPG
ncbi:MAG: proprotein convertase P-domain-containing protein [Desulfobulbales bacterium]|nr:proprotein convertase P-domain-containing protein [Desulfobulbales bacterium]